MTIAYAALDIQTGDLIAQREGGSRRAQASLTKLVSLHLIFNDIADKKYSIEDEIIIPSSVRKLHNPSNLNTDGAGFRYSHDESQAPLYKIDDLLKATAGASDCYAMIALAQKSEEDTPNPQNSFIEKMNDSRQSFGIKKNTRFVNATGIPVKAHYSTPRDVAMILKSLYDNHYDMAQKYLGQSRYKLRSITREFSNTSQLVGTLPDHLLFGKTGTTDRAGYCFGAVVKSNNRAYAITVFNAQSKPERDNAFLSIANQHIPQNSRRIKQTGYAASSNDTKPRASLTAS